MWWTYVVAAIVVLLAGYGFVSLTKFEKGWLTKRTERRAQDMYGLYGDDGKRRPFRRRS